MIDEAFSAALDHPFSQAGCGRHVGPFRRHKTAVRIREAIWDAARIRRCLGPPGKRSAPCAFSQLGVACCPCDGSLTPHEYAPIIDQVRRGHHHHPGSAARTAPGASGRAWPTSTDSKRLPGCEDRYQALAKAIERHRAWLTSRTGGTNLGRICRWCGLYRQRTTRRRLGAWYRSAAHSHPCSPGGFSSGPGIGGDGGRGPPRVEMAHCQPHQTVGVDVSADHSRPPGSGAFIGCVRGVGADQTAMLAPWRSGNPRGRSGSRRSIFSWIAKRAS